MANNNSKHPKLTREAIIYMFTDLCDSGMDSDEANSMFDKIVALGKKKSLTNAEQKEKTNYLDILEDECGIGPSKKDVKRFFNLIVQIGKEEHRTAGGRRRKTHKKRRSSHKTKRRY